jgi:protein O-GlcNAc transferase
MDLALASELYRVGRIDEAERACRAILARDVGNAAALSLLGLLHCRRGRTDEGIEMLRRACELQPDAPESLHNLAYVLGIRGHHAEAAGLLERSLQLRPAQPQVLYNLGVARERAGQLAQAERAYREAIALTPDCVEAHNGLGNVLRRCGRNEDAVNCHRAAIRVRPDFADAYAGLAHACGELGRQSEATACRRRYAELRPDSAGAGSDLLYNLHYDPAVSPQEMFEEHRRWARRHADPLTAHAVPHHNDRDPHRKLRVGYVSADFRAHPVARFQEPVLAHHDREAFEVFCYSDVQRPDAVTERLRSYADVWRDTHGLSDEQLAEQVREDRIDVLVDLAGHAAGNRLLAFARRPAPVQVTCNGYIDTTGMAAMDYRLTDALHDLPGISDRFHTERLVRLPACNWCYRPDDDRPPVSPSPCLSAGFVTFGSLNKFYKATPPMLDLWARILPEVPGSRLVLVVQGGDQANPSVRQSIVDRGLSAGRLDVLEKARSRREYLERFGRIDVALDTFPFNGITTTCDALWMGVPVVSLAGQTHVSRAGLSILMTVGMGELVATTPDEYVQCATQLAADAGRLSSLRAGLRQRMDRSPLRDESAYTRAVEAAYRAMWVSWCRA